MNLGPTDVFEPSSALWWDGADGGQFVEDLAQEQERPGAVVVRTGILVRGPWTSRAESEPEQPRFVERELQVGGPERPQPLTSPGRRIELPAAPHAGAASLVLSQRRVHPLAEQFERPPFNGLDEMFVPGEVVIGGGGTDANAPRCLAEYDGVRSALASQRRGRVDKGVPKVAVVVGVRLLRTVHKDLS